MKKIIAFMLVAVMLCLCLASCSNKDKLVVGITDFEPMDYKDKDGNWIGFDADMAKKFAEYLGREVEFVEIVWDNKVSELEAGTIDCVWNGMTLTDEVKAAMDCSEAYCNNQQIVIVPASKASDYQTVDSIKELTFAVEAGSAGAKAAAALGLTVNEVDSQAKALMEVNAGTSDAAIIDSLMAAAMVGEGTDYANLTYTVGLTDELYGVGFKKGSELTAKFNEFLKQVKEDGTLEACAKKYGIEASLIK